MVLTYVKERTTYPLAAGAELKSDAVVGLREIYIALARFILRRLSFTVVDSVPAFRVKLGANNLNCVDVLLNPSHSLTHSPSRAGTGAPV